MSDPLAAPAGLRERPLRDALERLAPADPWVGVEVTTESYQPADVCRECGRDKPRRKADRGFESHEPDCAWVQARRALASPETPEAGIDVERLARAMKQSRHDKVSPEMRAQGGWTMLTERDAAAIAAEYVRLASREEGERG